jgi:hypothetical protein
MTVDTYLNLPAQNQQTTNDSATVVKSFFDNYYRHKVSFPAAQVDAVVGYFLKKRLPK